MKKIVLAIGMFLIGTLILGLSYYYYVWNEHGNEQADSIAYAKEKYEITEVQDTNHYYGSHGAFDVIKSKVDGDVQYIFVPLDEKGESRMVDAEEGWSLQNVKDYVKQEIQPDELVSIRLGLEKFKESSPFTPIWEIVYKKNGNQYTFHYIRYEDGTFFKAYKMKQ